MNLVSGAKLAEMLKVSRKTVAAAFRKGWLTAAGHNKRGPLYNPETAIPEWEKRGGRQKHLSRHREGKKTGGRPRKVAPSIDEIPGDSEDIPEAGNFSDAFDLDKILEGLGDLSPPDRLDRADLAIKLARARLGALEVRKRECQLVEMEEVRRQSAALASQVMGVFSAVPGRLAHQLSAMTDADKIRELLKSELGRAIEMVRSEFIQPAGGGSEDAGGTGEQRE